MAVKFSSSSFRAVHDLLCSRKRYLDRDAEDLQQLIYEGAASDIEKHDLSEVKDEIAIICRLLKFLLSLEKGGES